MNNLFDLSGKVAIVTGASRGIGESIAVELARHGASVVVSDIAPGEDTVKKIRMLKRNAIYVKTDVSNENDVKNLINETIKRFGKIDILVNNAGIYKWAPTTSFSLEDWERTIHVDLRGVFLCSREALKHMKRGASIINISSIAGISGFPGSAAYCAAKGGVRTLTKSLASEFGKKGIRVNSVHPGSIDTPMTKGLLKDKKMRNVTISRIPLGRIGKPIDIAGPVVFLASDAAGYVTGEELVVDGGWIFSAE
ncbi:MAG: SDR family NAD(P)-dependent oxidoreductase [Candidatus Nanoarchaeia archaeon]|nr:SDR family NAD(P)-dependent oxidoreductase [Candidatus Nanoarchaeia archaeon]